MAFTPKKEKPEMRKSKGSSSKGGKFEPQPNSIRVFKNESDNEKAPSFTGQITLGDDLIEAIQDGTTEIRVALWKVSTEKGNRFLAGLVSLPYNPDAEDSDDEDDRPAKSSKKPAKGKPAKSDDWDSDDEDEY